MDFCPSVTSLTFGNKLQNPIFLLAQKFNLKKSTLKSASEASARRRQPKHYKNRNKSLIKDAHTHTTVFSLMLRKQENNRLLQRPLFFWPARPTNSSHTIIIKMRDFFLHFCMHNSQFLVLSKLVSWEELFDL